jgi:hypothetical protein
MKLGFEFPFKGARGKSFEVDVKKEFMKCIDASVRRVKIIKL